MSLLESKAVSKQYADKTILDRIDFCLQSGEILCLLGPSGSGKTTLLRVLAGLEAADQGQVCFAGHDMAAISPHKRNFGMMFQEYALFPHKNVADNICFGLEMQHWQRDRQQQRLTEMLALVGLDNYGNRRIDELSGGEQQRVALARSLAPQPQLLLLDEPLGSLDRMLRDRLAAEIRAILKSQGVTAVFVTHDQAEAFVVADKIAILQQGRLEQFASPEQVYRSPATAGVARFLGFRNILDFSTARLPEPDCLLDNLPEWFSKQGTGLLLIRPEAAAVSSGLEPGNLPQFSGQVLARRFQGQSYQLVVERESVQLTFDLAIDPRPPGKGESICLILNPLAMVWL
jgi:ABC-type Fe3+/spermidine/putrescine transport system ATPase subunit